MHYVLIDRHIKQSFFHDITFQHYSSYVPCHLSWKEPELNSFLPRQTTNASPGDRANAIHGGGFKMKLRQIKTIRYVIY